MSQSRKQKILGDVKKRRRQRTIASLLIAVGLIAIVGVAVYVLANQSNGQILIPGNVGFDNTCARPIHTHDTSGTLHVETDVNRNYTVGDFFLIWGKLLNSSGVFVSNQGLPSYLACVTGQLVYHSHPSLAIFYKKDGPKSISMTVNGNPEPLLQNYVLLKNAATSQATCTPPTGLTSCVPDNIVITYGPGIPTAF
jgi:hypothetical protein